MFPPNLFFSLGFPGEAVTGAPMLWAYLDPGSGSLLFQMMIAGLLSGAYVLRTTLWSMCRIVTRRLSREG
jgi:hypothetical protein